MENVLSTKESRRDFLKNAGKTSVAVAIGGIALAGCSSDAPRAQNGVKTGSTKKKEILYRSTKHWSSYYASAK